MLTPAAINKAVQMWEQFTNESGIDTQFTLRDGTQFTIKAVRKVRPDEKLTDGLLEQGFDVQFMHSHWHANAARGPEKGDQLVMAGRRHAIEFHKLHQIANVPVGYVCRVRG